MSTMEENDYGSVTLPQPEDIPEQARDQASGAYILMFAGLYIPLPFSEIVTSLVYYFYLRTRSQFLAFHTYQAFITQIPISILNTGLVVWVIINAVNWFSKVNIDGVTSFTGPVFWIYFWFVIAYNIVYIILSLIAYKKAIKGNLFYMPVIGGIAYEKFFGPNAVTFVKKEKKETNQPPKGY
ncbi:MAG: hypothetical protein JW969_05435 [Spirochaetales bacterium]|nr:hypothetical protein [Spirochaetales bacterium]